MTALEQLDEIFVEVFKVDKSMLNEHFNKENVEVWDSIHQLSLTSSVEDTFDIMLDVEDIIEFTSYDNVKRILSKYNIGL